MCIKLCKYECDHSSWNEETPQFQYLIALSLSVHSTLNDSLNTVRRSTLLNSLALNNYFDWTTQMNELFQTIWRVFLETFSPFHWDTLWPNGRPICILSFVCPNDLFGKSTRDESQRRYPLVCLITYNSATKSCHSFQKFSIFFLSRLSETRAGWMDHWCAELSLIGFSGWHLSPFSSLNWTYYRSLFRSLGVWRTPPP